MMKSILLCTLLISSVVGQAVTFTGAELSQAWGEWLQAYKPSFQTEAASNNAFNTFKANLQANANAPQGSYSTNMNSLSHMTAEQISESMLGDLTASAAADAAAGVAAGTVAGAVVGSVAGAAAVGGAAVGARQYIKKRRQQQDTVGNDRGIDMFSDPTQERVSSITARQQGAIKMMVRDVDAGKYDQE